MLCTRNFTHACIYIYILSQGLCLMFIQGLGFRYNVQTYKSILMPYQDMAEYKHDPMPTSTRHFSFFFSITTFTLGVAPFQELCEILSLVQSQISSELGQSSKYTPNHFINFSWHFGFVSLEANSESYVFSLMVGKFRLRIPSQSIVVVQRVLRHP